MGKRIIMIILAFLPLLVSAQSEMTQQQRKVSLAYGCHSLAHKEATFIRGELAVQSVMGHILVIPYSRMCNLVGLWLSPLSIILQEGRCLQLI